MIQHLIFVSSYYLRPPLERPLLLLPEELRPLLLLPLLLPTEPDEELLLLGVE